MFINKYELTLIDSGLIRSNFAGTYLIENGSEAALIEVSTSHAVPVILKKLDEMNINRDSVKYLFVTHIHLDHAGGAGTLLKELPNAKLVVHPSGAKHMVNPENLIKGANAVYGEDVVRNDYGTITPVPSDRIIECGDGEVFKVGDRELETIYTPGHARHHISIFDHLTRGIFTGDSMGLSYPELDLHGKRFYQPTTTPTAFEYEKMIESIDKMMNYKPSVLFFTHYGFSEYPLKVAEQIKMRLSDYVDIIMGSDKNTEKKLGEYYIKECSEYGLNLDKNIILNLFDIDIKLNAMGLKVWKERSK